MTRFRGVSGYFDQTCSGCGSTFTAAKGYGIGQPRKYCDRCVRKRRTGGDADFAVRLVAADHRPRFGLRDLVEVEQAITLDAAHRGSVPAYDILNLAPGREIEFDPPPYGPEWETYRTQVFPRGWRNPKTPMKPRGRPFRPRTAIVLDPQVAFLISVGALEVAS